MNTNQKKAGVATIIAGDFNTLPSIIDKTSRQKISIVPEDLKNHTDNGSMKCRVTKSQGFS